PKPVGECGSASYLRSVNSRTRKSSQHFYGVRKAFGPVDHGLRRYHERTRSLRSASHAPANSLPNPEVATSYKSGSGRRTSNHGKKQLHGSARALRIMARRCRVQRIDIAINARPQIYAKG